MSPECLDETTVLALAEGRLDEAAEARAREHVEGCTECRPLVLAVSKGPFSVSAMRTVESGPPNEMLDEDNRLAPGTVIADRWVIERHVGAGGMGYVVAARHRELGTLVAIKLLGRGLVADADARRRFDREAKTTARLAGPHIVKTHDVGRLDDGTSYLVMDLLEGEDLDTVVRRSGPLDVGDAVTYARQVALALASAHEQGVIHRDVKPSNLFLAASGIYVLDFGIAKTFLDLGKSAFNLTGEQQLLGTPSFMSPEQMLSSRDVDARADVWAFGTTLYFLLAGKAPFVAASIPMLCIRTSRDEPTALRELRPEIPEALAAIVRRCMRKTPAERYPTMRALLADLDAMSGADAQPATQPMPPASAPPEAVVLPKQGTPPWVLVLVAALVVLAAYALFVR